MSVDTYLKGKDTSVYRSVAHEDVTLLVTPLVARWAGRLRVATRRTLLGTRLDIAAEHEHGPT